MIQQLDTDLLLWLNGFHNSFFDNFMWNYTQTSTWIPLYLSIILFVIYRFRKDAIWVILSVVIAVGLSDFVASSIFKPMVERLRPSHVPELQDVLRVVNGYRGGQFGFMSSHAANTFALAAFITFIVRSRFLSCALFVWAALNAYSRIYLGVHYPGDVICGALLGCTLAYLSYFILNKFKPVYSDKYEISNHRVELGVICVWLFTVLYCMM